MGIFDKFHSTTSNPEQTRIEADKYYYGKDITVDKAKAARLYESVAECGDGYSQLMIGYIYDFGDGVKPNPQKAIKWYTEAANKGDSNAALNLANVYLQGRGIPVDIEKGILWLKKSAEAGNAIASSSLGRQYTLGVGVERSLTKAEFWIEKAEKLGYINCGTMTNLGLMYEETDNLVKAFECFSKALDADLGDLNAQYLYGQYKFYGKGTDSDVDEAKIHIQWVVQQNPKDEDACGLLAQIKLYEQIHTALDVISASLAKQAGVYDYHLQLIATNYGFVTYVRFTNYKESPFNKSEYYEKFNSIFSLKSSETSSLDDQMYEYIANIKYGNNKNINLKKLEYIIELIKKDYDFLSFERIDDYFVTKWRT